MGPPRTETFMNLFFSSRIFPEIIFLGYSIIPPMAYGRKYRKRYMPRARTTSKWGRRLDTASKALSIAYSLKRLINVEHKVSTVSLPSSPATAGASTVVNSIAEGGDWNERNGRSIKAVSLRVFGNCSLNAAASKNLYRIMVIRDNHIQSGSLVSGLPYLTSVSVNAIKNLDPTILKRYTILMDKTYNLEAGGKSSYHIDKYFKLNHHIKFDGATASDYGQGTLFVMTITDAATNLPIQNMQAQLRYIDN